MRRLDMSDFNSLRRLSFEVSAKRTPHKIVCCVRVDLVFQLELPVVVFKWSRFDGLIEVLMSADGGKCRKKKVLLFALKKISSLFKDAR